MSRHAQVLSARQVFLRRADAVVAVEVADGMGAGVVLSRSGLIATSHHLIEGWSHAKVRCRDGRCSAAPIVRSFRDCDLAFLQLDAATAADTCRGIHGALIADRAPAGRLPAIGETVYAIGHPLGLDYTLTQGIVSGVDREIEGRRFLQIDAAINPGNSGGPLYDVHAELVGIIACTRLESEGLNFAVPAVRLYQLFNLYRQERQQDVLQYCSVCGAASRDLDYCDHCGALLARIDPSVEPAEEESAEEPADPQPSGLEADGVVDPGIDPAADPVADSAASSACPVCGSLCQPQQRYCAICGATL